MDVRYPASHALCAFGLVALLAGCASNDAARAPQTEQGSMDGTAAVAFADRLTRLVDERALPPRDQDAYAAAKQRLDDVAHADKDQVDRALLYQRAREFLFTLDTDGHTILLSEAQTTTWYGATPPDRAGDATVARTLLVEGRAVLVVQPPQTTFVDPVPSSRYAATLKERVRAVVTQEQPCGVVVDLTESKGGNAWPALAVVGGLVSRDNDARYVDREGRRSIVFDDRIYRGYVNALSDQPANPLERYARSAFAVVINGNTTSAGEMMAIILSGESDVRVFGRPSYGATTSNFTESLPDHATLLLTTARYAHRDSPPMRGRLQPDVIVDNDEAAVLEAATWVARQSRACRSTSGR